MLNYVNALLFLYFVKPIAYYNRYHKIL